MGIFTLPILGMIGNAIGGILDRKSAKDQAFQSAQTNHNFRQEDRRWYLRDRQNERAYANKQTWDDRAYAQRQRDNEREYARDVLLDQRKHDAAVTTNSRKYEEQRLKRDRAYMDDQLKKDRAYNNQMYKDDLIRYDTDRDRMQARSDDLAEKTTASRGINFQKLRDDAIAAGYNPMTALSMAHAYSTETNYTLQGGVYSPRANYTTSNAAYSPTSGPSGGGGGSSGGGGAAPGAVMPSVAPAAGNFSAGGGGYQSQFNPALSAGSFVKEAVDRAIDTWSNKPVQNDPLADALRSAFEQDQIAQEIQTAQVPQGRGFGYDLTKQEQYQPEATIGVPSLAAAKKAPGPAKMPSGIVEKGGRKYVPVTLPDGSQSSLEASVARRYDIQPFDALSAGDWEEIRGGVVGEVENTVNADKNYDLMTGDNFWPVPPSASDYLKSGITGQRMLRSWPSN